MGCGCKKKKNQEGITSATARAANPNPVTTNQPNVAAVQESKDYQNKVKDALRQLMELKKRKRLLKK